MMTGLIWTVQLVHYPTFHFINASKFLGFEKLHTKAISIIVMPLMLFELATGAFLWLGHQNLILSLNLFLISFLFLWTFLVSAPLHRKLFQQGQDFSLIQKLIATNWPRTLIWTTRLILLTLLL